MLEHFIEYNVETGSVAFPAALNPDQLAVHRPAPGNAIMVIPYAARVGEHGYNLDIMRPWVMTQVDRQAEAFRMNFLTAGAGQALTYLYKADEARAYNFDATAVVPFLTAEAAARGVPVADVAAEVLAQVDAWVGLGSAIEGARMAAKAAISEAQTIEAILLAGTVNWRALATA